jgi:hypothetical protein
MTDFRETEGQGDADGPALAKKSSEGIEKPHEDASPMMPQPVQQWDEHYRGPDGNLPDASARKPRSGG